MTYAEIKRIVEDKLIYRTEDRGYEELSELLFGEGNCFNESEVRKRMYGMKTLIEVIEAEKMSGVATRILSISDLHVPFQLDHTLLKDYRNVDILQINGDVVDCQALSRFPKQYRISPMEEIIQGRQYLIELIEYIRPKKVVCNMGNHDARFSAYIAKNIDTDILELMPNSSLDLIFTDGLRRYDKLNKSKVWYEPLCNVFDDIEIEYVDDWKSRIGKTIFCHPLSYRSGMLATADKAKQYFHDTETEPFDCIVMAHTHKLGDVKRGHIQLYEQGAFADVSKLDYANGKLVSPQQSGFAFICQDEDGNLLKEKSKVIEL